jgi:hypothetical protein
MTKNSQTPTQPNGSMPQWWATTIVIAIARNPSISVIL